MIDSKALLSDLQRLLPKIEADISQYASVNAEVEQQLKQQYEEAKAAERTADHWVDFRAAQITQSAVAWVLACVFIRFIEDNQLIPQPVIAGPSEGGLQLAKDAATVYFREHPAHAEREYLNHQFDALSKIPVMASLLDKAHNPLWALPVSADGAKALIDFFQQPEPETGEIIHDFTDPDWSTRFLGDLYQDLSESVRKRYALLQTPDFVEEFILDYTLRPAMQTFGIKGLRMIDPTCGSGHFLLSGFARVFDAWLKKEPQTNTRELAQRALNSVHGIDINPYAVAIARFRLLIAAMQAAGSDSIHRTPDFQFNLAVGDSLLHGKRHESGGQGIQLDSLDDTITHVLNTEDRPELERILGQRYQVVVGNPPYITVKDKALNKAYRDKYLTCHRQYSMGVPFTERFFDLTQQEPEAGFMGMITTNSFMKRECGKKLIEEYFPEKDLTHVIDTSGAYIPGHGTPTVILYARNGKPVQDTVRAVLGIRGEPSTPDDPAEGKVWSSVVGLLEKPNTENEFVSSVEQDRELYGRHPWSVGGGGALELKLRIESLSNVSSLAKHIDNPIGRSVRVAEEDVFHFSTTRIERSNADDKEFKIYVVGQYLRDWSQGYKTLVWYPYQEQPAESGAIRELWAFKTLLANRKTFQGLMRDAGLEWFEYMQHTPSAYKTPLSIIFAFVASHNHFVLDRGGKVFKQSAPAIKLPADATEEDHLVLLGLLNSSTACFWGRQVFYPKGGYSAGKWEERLEWDGTKLKEFPVPPFKGSELLERTSVLDRLSSTLARLDPATVLLDVEGVVDESMNKARCEFLSVFNSMVAEQEELDWHAYVQYGISKESLNYKGQLPEIRLGERAFEILIARKMDDDKSIIAWFDRHNSQPITEIPARWPTDYQELVQKRIEAMENNKWIGLIEQPEYKRRWAVESWDDKVARATRENLLNIIEQSVKNSGILELKTAALLANQLQSDTRFQQVAEVYVGTNTFNLQDLITDLVNDEAVPQMAASRYKPNGMTKFRAWQETWDLQRREDAGETLDIPVPPKYAKGDFSKPDYWKHRGKLDVPKERFFSLPNCEKAGDTTPVIGWAGLNHLQRATAIAAWYLERKENDGWQTEQLMPMLAALEELLPWLKQWHNEIDLEYNERMGDYYSSFLNEELRSLNLTIDEVRDWQPPAPVRKASKKRASKKKKAK